MTDKNLPTLTSSDGFNRYLTEINYIPSLTEEEEFMLAKNYLDQHDLKAAHKLVISHLKLVAKIAMKYRSYGLPITDLVSEGNIGLMQAVKKYNPDLGYRLSTYAMWWIKAAIQEYVLRSWSLVKIGTTSGQRRLFFSLGKIKNKIANLYARPVNEQDYPAIADELGVSIKEVTEMNQRLSGGDISLNSIIDKSGEEGDEMIDFLPSFNPTPEALLMQKQSLSNRKEILTQALGILSDREEKILTARKLSQNPSTLDTLSHEYDISKERIRQIENRAFAKVQNFILSKISSHDQIKTIEGS